jgi:3-hydroxyisobutyrate dehydrogenase
MVCGMAETIGFIGLGTMGEPMALNLARGGTALLVWNRTPGRCETLRAAGATIAETPAEVFARAHTILLMLADEAAMDAVLARGTADFALRVGGRRIVSMGTFRPSWSAALAADVAAQGGAYVEAPVSGSRGPAQSGTLVAMLAGEAEDVAAIRPLMAVMSHEILSCGAVPGALRMKLAVNLFLITMVTGLVEACHFADRLGLDPALLTRILGAGPMASAVSRAKADKLLAGDFSRQASIADVFKNSALVAQAAREAQAAAPLLDAAHALYGETLALGLADQDMIAVLRALEQRSARRSPEQEGQP